VIDAATILGKVDLTIAPASAFIGVLGIVACGYISSYNDTEIPSGPKNYWLALENQITVRGLLVTDYYHLGEDFYREVGPWIRTGRVCYRETIYEGLDKAVDAFLGLFTGANIGKMMVKI